MRLVAVGLSALLLSTLVSVHQPQTPAIHAESQGQFGALDLARLDEFLQETVEPATIQHSEGADEFAPKEFELRCASMAHMDAHLRTNWHEERRADLEDLSGGVPLLLYVTPSNETWTKVALDRRLDVGCIIASGYGWRGYHGPMN